HFDLPFPAVLPAAPANGVGDNFFRRGRGGTHGRHLDGIDERAGRPKGVQTQRCAGPPGTRPSGGTGRRDLPGAGGFAGQGVGVGKTGQLARQEPTVKQDLIPGGALWRKKWGPVYLRGLPDSTRSWMAGSSP